MVGDRPPLRLRDLDACFQGQPPAVLATCSPEGVPNVSLLSVVHRVDDSHVALSFQFFNKSRQNILANPRAHLLVVNQFTFVQYRLRAHYLRTETAGPVFDRARSNLDAIASQSGMTGVFRLRGADIYRVEGIEELVHDLDLSPPEGPPDILAALDVLSTRLAECDDLDQLLETTLKGLAESFDYPHSMILFTDAAGKRLYTVASHGFPTSGVGAETAVGEGLIGVAALERRPVRMVNLRISQLMAGAVRSIAEEHGYHLDPQIPLPGLPDAQSEIAVPILARDRTLGVLCVQSTQPGRLTTSDEHTLSTVARHLATSILLLGPGTGGEASNPRAEVPRQAGTRPVQIRYHAADDSIFLDEEYLIRGLPGRILVRLLGIYERDGRSEFTNKELRADETLQLADYRDNLEARLLLLRRRLEERTGAMRLSRSGRGRFRLEVTRSFVLLRR